MAEDLFIPKLGQTVEEVVLINRLVGDGAQVDFGDPVLEVETDKAIFNIEANAKGYIHFGPYQIGEIIPVLTVIAIIGEKDDHFSPGENAPSETRTTEGNQAYPPLKTEIPEIDHAKTDVVGTDKVFASPRAKKLAQEKKVDLSFVKPTGGNGIRVIEDDVIAYLSHAPKATPIAAALAQDVGLELTSVDGTGPNGKITKDDVIKKIRELISAVKPSTLSGDATSRQHDTQVKNVIPITSVRKVIFSRMAASVHSTARVTLVTEVDATELVKYREKKKNELMKTWGFAPSYSHLLGMILSQTLQEFPYMNARLSTDEKSIEILDVINLGIAMDTDRGLIVPVIKDANSLGLHEFCSKFIELSERAKKGQSTPEDLSGGTFTITNLGSFDIDAFTPVINLPEAAILGIGKIQDKVVAYQDDVSIRKIVTLSLVFDHRLIDGAPAARFLQAIKYKIASGSIQ